MSEPYSGTVGLRLDPIETSPSVFIPNIQELPVRGIIRRVISNWSSGDSDQEQRNVTHTVELVVSDQQAPDFFKAVYFTWMGEKWSVRKIEREEPNIRFTLGGVYDGRV